MRSASLLGSGTLMTCALHFERARELSVWMTAAQSFFVTGS
jgi:hypothetical protein